MIAQAVDLRATLRKVSRRLIPFLFLLYVAAYLDRINVGFAQLQMKSALGFSDSVYGLGAGIFFIGYFLFEVPSNLILARVGARVWIARIMITWGLISSAMAFVHSPASFYVLRFLLGAAEAGFFPGVIYYLGLWFPAAERASAVSRFMTATAIAGVVGGADVGGVVRSGRVRGRCGMAMDLHCGRNPVRGAGRDRVVLSHRSSGRGALANGRGEARSRRPHRRGGPDDRRARGNVAQRAAPSDRLVSRRFVFLAGDRLLQHQLLDAADHRVASRRSGASEVALVLGHSVRRRGDCDGDRRRALRSHRRTVRTRRDSLRSSARAGIAASAYGESPIVGVLALSIAAVGIWSAVPVFWSLPTMFLSGTAAAGAIALINSFGNLGGFVGPFVIGRVHVSTGSYAASLMMVAGSLLCSVALALALRRARATFSDAHCVC